MDDEPVRSTIEKIKLQEHKIENKLKEKREYEAELAGLNRDIKDTVSQTSKSNQECLDISKRIQKLRLLLEIEKNIHRAHSAQLEAYTKIFEDLRAQSNQGIAEVWSLRSSLCETVQRVSDCCDIWALLMRPVCSLPQPQRTVNKDCENDKKIINNECRLKTALQRRKETEAKREQLLTEPNTGEEFIRIKNALHYSFEKIASIHNTKM